MTQPKKSGAGATVTLKQVLEAASDKVDSRRLGTLQEKLEGAFDCRCSEIPVDDPMLIRRRLIEYMRLAGSTEGIVQSYEQLFMGVARRAALKGVIQPPPEGPWTHRWQSVLVVASDFKGAKMEIRCLAAWATSRGVEPEEVNSQVMERWISEVSQNLTTDRARVGAVLSEYRKMVAPEAPNSLLWDRLKQKSLRGSVRTVQEVYGSGKPQEGNARVAE
jgi:hypothetical protein